MTENAAKYRHTPLPSGVHLCEARIVLEQAGDTWQSGDDAQWLTIELPPCVQGDYYAVLSTERWAVDSGDELRQLADLVDRLIAAGDGHG